MAPALIFLGLVLLTHSCGPRTASCPTPDRAVRTALLKRSLSYLEQNIRPGGLTSAGEPIRVGLHDELMDPPVPYSLFGKEVVFVNAAASPIAEFHNSEDLLISFTYWNEYCLATLHFFESASVVLKARPPEDWQLATLKFIYRNGAWELAGPETLAIDYPPQ